MNPITLKRLGFIAFLAMFIALFMIGGIWFASSWIPSPWFWLADVGFLAVSIVALIMWQIDLAYFGITLEPEDLIEDDEAAEKDMKKPAVPVKKQAAILVSTVKAVKPVKLVAIKPSSEKDAASGVTARPAATPKPASLPAKKAAPITTSQKQLTVAKPAAVDAEKAKTEAAKLHDTFAAVPPETSKQGQPSVSEEKKFKITKKNVFSMIEAYAGADYTYFSFSKIRKELGAVKDKDALKLKKYLINACELGFLVKKGSKYYLQKE